MIQEIDCMFNSLIFSEYLLFITFHSFQNSFQMGLYYYAKLYRFIYIVLIWPSQEIGNQYFYVRINFYLLQTFCPHLGSFLCCFFFHFVSAKFHLWPSSGDLPRPRIGMLSLVTVSPVITAFHSCCLSHHAFLSEVAVNHLKKARSEIWPKRSEKRNNTKNYQDEDKKSAINKN